MEFRSGVPVAPLKATGASERRGTEVHFLASKEVFGTVDLPLTTSWHGACASFRSSTTASDRAH